MYQNRIRRTSTNIRPNSHPQFFIRRSEIAFDERLPFIESVLETLLESRFGPGGVYQSVLRSSDRPELEPVAFSDMLGDDPNCLIPCYTTSPLGRAYSANLCDLCALCGEKTLGRTKYFLTQRTQRTQRTNSSVFFVPSVVKISLGRGSP